MMVDTLGLQSGESGSLQIVDNKINYEIFSIDIVNAILFL